MIRLLLVSIFLPPMLTYDLSKTCQTTFTTLKCDCEKGENITLSPIHNDIIKKIKFKGCETVNVQFASLSNLQLEELDFFDIERLHFEYFSLGSLNDLSSIRIENVLDLDFDIYSLKGMQNVNEFVIRNSVINVLKKESFGEVINVNYMLIENTTFDLIEELAFNVFNITKLHVKNSKFQSFENGSINVLQSEEVLFENCEFAESVDSMFDLNNVDSVTFQSCTFIDLATTFLHSKEINTFTISNCTIKEIKPDAFAAIDVLKRASFKNNAVENTYPHTLSPFLSYNDTIVTEYCCNYITCDCSMYWLWEYDKSYPNISVLQNSLCISDPKKDLSFYAPVLDSNNSCNTMQFKVVDPPDLISLTVKSQGIAQICNAKFGLLSYYVIFLFICILRQNYYL